MENANRNEWQCEVLLLLLLVGIVVVVWKIEKSNTKPLNMFQKKLRRIKKSNQFSSYYSRVDIIISDVALAWYFHQHLLPLHCQHRTEKKKSENEKLLSILIVCTLNARFVFVPPSCCLIWLNVVSRFTNQWKIYWKEKKRPEIKELLEKWNVALFIATHDSK